MIQLTVQGLNKQTVFSSLSLAAKPDAAQRSADQAFFIPRIVRDTDHGLGGGSLRFGAGLGAKIPLGARETIVFEVHGEPVPGERFSSALQRIDVVPTLLMKHVYQHGGAQHIAYLVLVHPGLQLVDHVLIDHVPLLYVHLVDERKIAQPGTSAYQHTCTEHPISEKLLHSK